MKKINLSLLSTLVLFTGLTRAEAALQNQCANPNEPIVLSTCVSYETPNETALYENASCSMSSFSNRWSCGAGYLQYTNQSKLYFPMTGATVIKRTEHRISLDSYGWVEEEARANLKVLLANLPKSVLLTEICKK